MVNQELIKDLQLRLHARRKILMEVRREMDEIEAELLPMLAKDAALNKLKLAGLSEAELKELLKNG